MKILKIDDLLASYRIYFHFRRRGLAVNVNNGYCSGLLACCCPDRSWISRDRFRTISSFHMNNFKYINWRICTHVHTVCVAAEVQKLTVKECFISAGLTIQHALRKQQQATPVSCFACSAIPNMEAVYATLRHRRQSLHSRHSDVSSHSRNSTWQHGQCSGYYMNHSFPH